MLSAKIITSSLTHLRFVARRLFTPQLERRFQTIKERTFHDLCFSQKSEVQLGRKKAGFN